MNSIIIPQNDDMTIYSTVVFSVSLKRAIKVTYTEFTDKKGKIRVSKLFFSADVNMSVLEIVNYYKVRFQIEYLYRDARLFTEIQHRQSRNPSKLNNHINISLTAVSIGKALLRHQISKDEKMPLSIPDICSVLKNRKMIYRVFSKYDFHDTSIKLNPTYRELLYYGKIAA